MNKTKDEYVVVLDEQYNDFKTTVHKFAYLTNKDRGRGNYIGLRYEKLGIKRDKLSHRYNGN